MGFSFIVIDKQNKLNLDDFIQYATTKTTDFEVLYCSSKKIENNYVRNYVFSETENTEKILNAVISKCQMPNLVIIRDVNVYKNFDGLLTSYKYNNQIILIKSKKNKFKKFLFNTCSKIIKLFFYHNLIDADYSIALYGELATKVLKNVQSPAILLKTNNWTGIECVLINGEIGNYKFEYSKSRSIIKTIVPFLIFIFVLVFCCVIKFQIMPVFTVLCFFIMLLSLFMSVMYGFKWVLSSYMGDSISDKAKYE